MLLMITWPTKKTIACMPSRKEAAMISPSSGVCGRSFGRGMRTAANIEADMAPTAPMTPYPSSTRTMAIATLEPASSM